MRAPVSTTKILLFFIILGSFLFAYPSLEGFLTYSKVSALETYGGFGAYWDNECTQRVTSIEWGTLMVGSKKEIAFFVRNEGDYPMSLVLSTENWNPAIAGEQLNIEWNYSNEAIQPDEKLPIMLTLVIPFVSGFDDFSVDILIGAAESDLVLSNKIFNNWDLTTSSQINSVSFGDVDRDGDIEVVTGGYGNDGTRDVAQLVVCDGETLAIKNLASWDWSGNARINSVAVKNLDKDDALEIVTGGYYFDGTRKVAQLVVWDGKTLAVDNLVTWYWTSDTEIKSINVEDINHDGSFEIITGGFYFDGIREVAQLVVWNSKTMTALRYTSWYWTGNTRINSIDVKNVDSDSTLEIITGGYYTDGRKTAQLVVWDGILLSPENIQTWYWTSDTQINSVVAANIDDDSAIEIVTGGYYKTRVNWRTIREIAQLVVWSNDLQTVENIATWYWTGNTRINSVDVGDVDSDGSIEIVTGGKYNDLSRDNAQLVVWDASTLTVDYLDSWYWTKNTCINSIAVSNSDSDFRPKILTGGFFQDNIRTNAQITIWQIS